MKAYSLQELQKIYDIPFMKLLSLASQVQREHHPIGELESCMLFSVKTGNCTEDCAYCSQSIHYQTAVLPHQLLEEEAILQGASRAKERGATHFCLSTSGREVKSEKDFSLLLKMVEKISSQGIQVCSTLGLLTEEKALRLKDAGLHAYNHNLDTGPKYYPKIITTRSYQDRLDTIALLQRCGMRVCTGLILGMGESVQDRLEWLIELLQLKKEPDFIPINILMPQKGTPLENQKPIASWDVIRLIAVIRIVFPKAKIRFAAGRGFFSFADQALAFMAGINSIHIGEKLLTVADCRVKEDARMIKELDLMMI